MRASLLGLGWPTPAPALLNVLARPGFIPDTCATGVRSYPELDRPSGYNNHRYGAAEIHHNTLPTIRQPLLLPSTTLSCSWFSDSSSSTPSYLRSRDTHKPSSS